MLNDITSRYRVLRARALDATDDPTQIERLGRGSAPPPSKPAGLIRYQRIGEHQVEVQRDGQVVTIALAGALRLRGRPDQIRGLAAALLAALE